MPGLIGVVGTGAASHARKRFDTALHRMMRHRGVTSAHVSACDGALLAGRVQLETVEHPAASKAGTDGIARTGGPTAVFHGVLYNEQELRNQLRSEVPAESVPALLSALYVEHGTDLVRRLAGEFALTLIDPNQNRILVATDTVGNYPIYWRADQDGFIFCSDLSALLCASPRASRLDLRAVADYLTLGSVLGDKTLVEDVRVLDPGTVLIYDASPARVSISSYVKLETFFHNKVTDKAAYLEALPVAFTDAVTRAAHTARPLGLSLSGGLDSRAILSALASRAASASSYTLGVDGCADQVIAERLARIAGTHHSFFRLDSSYLRDFLPNMAQMVSITDGMYLSHGLTEMLALQFLDATGIGVLLRGHGGELAKSHLAWPLHTDAAVYRMQAIDELVPYLSARANYVTPDIRLPEILTESAAAAAGEGSRDAFALILKDTGLSPADSCSFLYLRELNRRFTIPSLELFRTRVDVRLPYLDPQFLAVLLGAPSHWRDSVEIHRTILAAGDARLSRVRNSNTGARVTAGPRQEFVLDKLNTALKRLNVRGYRHYHNFGAWMRDMLLRTVETELLAPTARVQAFIPKTTLEKLIRETRDGVADRSYLLQVLLILELWQRENSVEAAA